MLDSQPRILALDLHAFRSGFAVLEDESRLIGWGLFHYPRKSVARRRAMFQFATLVARYRPERIVATLPANQRFSRKRIARTLAALQLVSQRSRIPIRVMPREKVIKMLGVRNRYAAAVLVADRFPVIRPRLPAPRRLGYSEARAMGIFDAAAAGLAYLGEANRRAQRAMQKAA